MSEQHDRQVVGDCLRRARLDARAVENAVGPGTPDVNHACGWLELKFLHEWPARPDTVVRVPKYTPQQRVWHRRRSSVGGKVDLLLHVGTDWLLFRGDVAAKVVGHVPRAELEQAATVVWRSTADMVRELPSHMRVVRAV